jgi:transcriptional regulator with XRE-family HTH domain
MISATQCRMARAALRWTVRELADKARINHNTVIRFENEKHDANEVTVLAMRQAFEAAGLLFIDADDNGGVGVREKRASE